MKTLLYSLLGITLIATSCSKEEKKYNYSCQRRIITTYDHYTCHNSDHTYIDTLLQVTASNYNATIQGNNFDIRQLRTGLPACDTLPDGGSDSARNQCSEICTNF